jgi:hypothetical protein
MQGNLWCSLVLKNIFTLKSVKIIELINQKYYRKYFENIFIPNLSRLYILHSCFKGY